MWYKKELPKGSTGMESDKFKAYVGHSFSDMNLVGQYENAVNLLYNGILAKGDRFDMIAHPLLYLMRHSIELALKENIRYLDKYSRLGLGKIKTHSIETLFGEFDRHYTTIANELGFKEEYSGQYDAYTIKLKDLISKLGEDWSSFRYVYATSGAEIFDPTVTVDLYEMKDKYDNSIRFLAGTADAISPYTNFDDYAKVDASIKEVALGYVLLPLLVDEKKATIINFLNKDYQIISENELWYDKKSDRHLILKKANNKCYIIPIKSLEMTDNVLSSGGDME